MTPELVISITQKALELAMAVVLLVLVPALIVGLLAGMFQAATQINEMTLSFIPKLLVTVLVLFLAGPLILRMLSDFTLRLFHSIPSVIG